MSAQRKSATQAVEGDPDLAGAETAMHRAAWRARQRAEQAANTATALPPTENPGNLPRTVADPEARPRSAGRPSMISQAPPPVTPPRGTSYGGTSPQTPLPDADSSRVDDEHYSFSQAQGYETIPGPLKLGELPEDARTGIWNLVFDHISQSITREFLDALGGGPWIRGAWGEILRAKHCHFEHRPADDWNPQFSRICKDLRQYIEPQPFNRVFDLIQFVLRQRVCPRSFTARMRDLFTQHYAIDLGPPPTIVPAATPEEGNTVVSAAETLRRAGLRGSALHLSKASECLSRGDWAGSVRESIHAIESVARQLDPEAARTLGPALASLQRHGVLHPALKDAFSKLYGYTSNEQGVRHPLLDRTHAQVGHDEAVFMLGACASFASYLWRKHVAGEPR